MLFLRLYIDKLYFVIRMNDKSFNLLSSIEKIELYSHVYHLPVFLVILGCPKQDTEEHKQYFKIRFFESKESY